MLLMIDKSRMPLFFPPYQGGLGGIPQRLDVLHQCLQLFLT